MRISVVLCTYSPDQYDEFVDAAESLYQQTYSDVEVVIVVDGDATVFRRARADFGDRDTTVIHANEENKGLLHSRNVGAELASGNYIAFIDDDAIAHQDWVTELAKSYREHDALAVGGQMIPRWIAGKPEHLPAEFYWLIGVTHRGFADTNGEVRNTFGSNLSFRRDVFLELGGFNTAVGGRQGAANLQGGETELCARLRKCYGRGVWYNPEAIVEHKIFDYRTKPIWLIDRAFWQGYSKRAMESFVADTSATEAEFLRQLLVRFVPARIRSFVRRPSLPKLEQFVMLWLLTAAVGLGYCYGILRWNGPPGEQS